MEESWWLVVGRRRRVFSGDTSISDVASDKSSRNNMEGNREKALGVGSFFFLSFLLLRNEICLLDYYWKAAEGEKEREWADGSQALVLALAPLRSIRFHLFILITMTRKKSNSRQEEKRLPICLAHFALLSLSLSSDLHHLFRLKVFFFFFSGGGSCCCSSSFSCLVIHRDPMQAIGIWFQKAMPIVST